MPPGRLAFAHEADSRGASTARSGHRASLERPHSSSVEAMADRAGDSRALGKRRSTAIQSPLQLPHNTIDSPSRESQSGTSRAGSAFPADIHLSALSASTSYAKAERPQRSRISPQSASERKRLSFRQGDVPQHRNASQGQQHSSRAVSAGSTTGLAINVDSSESESEAASPLRRDARSNATRPDGLSKSTTLPLEPSLPPKRKLAVETSEEDTVGPARAEPERKIQRTRLIPPGLPGNGNTESEGDESRDPMDLLSPSKYDRSVAASPVYSQHSPDSYRGRASQMAGKNSRLGRQPASSLTVRAHPDRQGTGGQHQASELTIRLKDFSIGDVFAALPDTDPCLTYRNSDRAVELTCQEGGKSLMLTIECSDFQFVDLQASISADWMLLHFKLAPNSASAANVREHVREFDPKSSQTTITCRAQHDQGPHWTSFCSWFKSARPEIRYIDLSAAKTLHQLGAPAVRKMQQRAHLEEKLAGPSGVGRSYNDPNKLATARDQDRGPLRLEGAKSASTAAPAVSSAAPAFRPRPRPTAKVAIDTSSVRGYQASPRYTRSSSTRLTDENHSPALKSATADEPRKTSPSRPRGRDRLFLRFPSSGPGSVQIFESDLDRLRDGEFLNDTLIEFGLKYHLEAVRSRDVALFNSLYVFNTFFYKKLTQSKRRDDTYKQIRKWTAKVDIFSKRMLVIPINEHVHWYLAIVLNPGKALDFTESDVAPTDRLSAPISSATRAQRMRESESREDSGDPEATSLLPTAVLPRGDPNNIAAAKHCRGDDKKFEDSYRSMSLQEREISAGDPSRETQDPLAIPEQDEGDMAKTSPVSSRIVPSCQTSSSDALTEYMDILSSKIADEEPLGDSASSNIENAGQGRLVGGGDIRSTAFSKKPAMIRPGESIQKLQSSTNREAPPVLQSGGQHRATYGSPRPSALATASASTFYGKADGPPKSTRLDVKAGDRGMKQSPDGEELPIEDADSSTSLAKGRKRAEEATTRDRSKLDELVVLTFDSLGAKHTSVRTAVNHYLRNEALDKKKLSISPEAEYINVAVPGQQNFCDCGLFVLLCECINTAIDQAWPCELRTKTDTYPAPSIPQISNVF